MRTLADVPQPARASFVEGTAIPALPLALHEDGSFDSRRQRALLRYYTDSGVGGIAVGVHSTQFAIRRPEVGLFRPLLELASEEIDTYSARRGRQGEVFKIAGVVGRTHQAVSEARLAVSLGYHACLLGIQALNTADADELVVHIGTIAEIMPVVGFYLQPAVGGRLLPFSLWRRVVEIPNVVAVKVAPFDRYATIDVVRAVAAHRRNQGETDRHLPVLYTGNDDSIVTDLLTPFRVNAQTGEPTQTTRIVGGLLGQFGVWTKASVDLFRRVRAAADREETPGDLLAIGSQLTDTNAAIFDAANRFRGVIPGIHEVLRRSGLMETTRCLDPAETLSPGQSAEIDRVIAAYPHLRDDDFVRENLNRWLS